MASIHHVFPAPPASVWQALPRAVSEVKGETPFYDQNGGSVTFSTKLSFLTWGQTVKAQISPTDDGRTSVEVHTRLKFGLVDWGEGKKICQRFVAGIDAALTAGSPQH